ncbi:uncharacterized protein DS421_20g700130 [Arachis hypogaea]|nr:uncharacterized protein DS421_20g700130 [Arachis hypogaea]
MERLGSVSLYGEPHWPRKLKVVDLPMFDGEGVEDWIFRARQYLETFDILVEQWIWVLSFHLINAAYAWLINPYFMMYFVPNSSDLFNPSPTYSCKLHGFTFPSLLCDICEKHGSYTLKILILITLYYHSMP